MPTTSSSPEYQVKTRFLIISDTHAGRPTEFYNRDGAFRQPLPKAHVLLHCGDLTMKGLPDQYETALASLASVDAELKLVIAGNHDLSLHADYYLRDRRARFIAGDDWDEDAPRRAREFWTGPKAKAAGVTYLAEGLYKFSLSNGAYFTIYASPWQPEFCGWAFNYPHEEDRWSPADIATMWGATPAPPQRDPHPIPLGENVDIFMTHGPAHTHRDRCERDRHQAGCPHLLRALKRLRPLLHCCGHIHEAWGVERLPWARSDTSTGIHGITEVLAGVDDDGQIVRPTDSWVIRHHAAMFDFSSTSPRPLKRFSETIMVNASVLNLRYRPDHAPVVVDLDLRRIRPTLSERWGFEDGSVDP